MLKRVVSDYFHSFCRGWIFRFLCERLINARSRLYEFRLANSLVIHVDGSLSSV